MSSSGTFGYQKGDNNRQINVTGTYIENVVVGGDGDTASLTDPDLGLDGVSEAMVRQSVAWYLEACIDAWKRLPWLPATNAVVDLWIPRTLTDDDGNVREPPVAPGDPVVVVGDSGSGKSMICRRWALEVAQQAQMELAAGARSADITIPLLVECAQLVRHASGRLPKRALIDAALSPGSLSAVTFDQQRYSVLASLLSNRATRLKVYLDGLDEAGRPEISAPVIRALAERENLTIVVSSRPEAWERCSAHLPREPDLFRRLNLNPLSYPDDVETYADAWALVTDSGRASPILESLTSSLLSQALTQPIILAIYYATIGQGRHERVVDLYETFANNLLARGWNGPTGDYETPRLNTCRDLLSSWAWRSCTSESGALVAHWPNEFATGPVDMGGLEAAAVANVARPVDQGAFQDPRRRFVHRSMQEYFVAQAMKNIPPDELAELIWPRIWDAGDWKSTLPMVLACHPDRDRLVDLLEEKVPAEVPRSYCWHLKAAFDDILLGAAALTLPTDWTESLQQRLGEARVRHAWNLPMMTRTSHWLRTNPAVRDYILQRAQLGAEGVTCVYSLDVADGRQDAFLKTMDGHADQLAMAFCKQSFGAALPMHIAAQESVVALAERGIWKCVASGRPWDAARALKSLIPVMPPRIRERLLARFLAEPDLHHNYHLLSTVLEGITISEDDASRLHRTIHDGSASPESLALLWAYSHSPEVLRDAICSLCASEPPPAGEQLWSASRTLWGNPYVVEVARAATAEESAAIGSAAARWVSVHLERGDPSYADPVRVAGEFAPHEVRQSLIDELVRRERSALGEPWRSRSLLRGLVSLNPDRTRSRRIVKALVSSRLAVAQEYATSARRTSGNYSRSFRSGDTDWFLTEQVLKLRCRPEDFRRLEDATDALFASPQSCAAFATLWDSLRDEFPPENCSAAYAKAVSTWLSTEAVGTCCYPEHDCSEFLVANPRRRWIATDTPERRVDTNERLRMSIESGAMIDKDDLTVARNVVILAALGESDPTLIAQARRDGADRLGWQRDDAAVRRLLFATASVEGDVSGFIDTTLNELRSCSDAARSRVLAGQLLGCRLPEHALHHGRLIILEKLRDHAGDDALHWAAIAMRLGASKDDFAAYASEEIIPLLVQQIGETAKEMIESEDPATGWFRIEHVIEACIGSTASADWRRDLKVWVERNGYWGSQDESTLAGSVYQLWRELAGSPLTADDLRFLSRAYEGSLEYVRNEFEDDIWLQWLESLLVSQGTALDQMRAETATT